MSERRSMVQVEPQPAGDQPVGEVDVTKDLKFSMTARQLWRLVAVVAVFVLAVAAILPNLLPKKFTIATQTYVEESVAAAKADGFEVVKQNTEAIDATKDEVGAIKVTLTRVVDNQDRQIASSEADRVTQRIRNPDRRVREYERVRKQAMRNLKAEPPREPLEGVDLEF